jgi:hypothetical protein
MRHKRSHYLTLEKAILIDALFFSRENQLETCIRLQPTYSHLQLEVFRGRVGLGLGRFIFLEPNLAGQIGSN